MAKRNYHYQRTDPQRGEEKSRLLKQGTSSEAEAVVAGGCAAGA